MTSSLLVCFLFSVFLSDLVRCYDNIVTERFENEMFDIEFDEMAVMPGDVMLMDVAFKYPVMRGKAWH